MKQDDRLSFVAAMEKEINDHENRTHWHVVHRDTLPAKAKPIKAIWSFKQKRAPDGSLLKHKARMCAHGGTYAAMGRQLLGNILPCREHVNCKVNSSDS